jgi:hypothetical protein
MPGRPPPAPQVQRRGREEACLRDVGPGPSPGLVRHLYPHHDAACKRTHGGRHRPSALPPSSLSHLPAAPGRPPHSATPHRLRGPREGRWAAGGLAQSSSHTHRKGRALDTLRTPAARCTTAQRRSSSRSARPGCAQRCAACRATCRCIAPWAARTRTALRMVCGRRCAAAAVGMKPSLGACRRDQPTVPHHHHTHTHTCQLEQAAIAAGAAGRWLLRTLSKRSDAPHGGGEHQRPRQAAPQGAHDPGEAPVDVARHQAVLSSRASSHQGLVVNVHAI